MRCELVGAIPLLRHRHGADRWVPPSYLAVDRQSAWPLGHIRRHIPAAPISSVFIQTYVRTSGRRICVCVVVGYKVVSSPAVADALPYLGPAALHSHRHTASAAPTLGLSPLGEAIQGEPKRLRFAPVHARLPASLPACVRVCPMRASPTSSCHTPPPKGTRHWQTQ